MHAVGFEAIALMICAPLGAWLMNRPMAQVGALTLMLSSVAMLWNILYNSLFDRLCPPNEGGRSLLLRTGHALGFEAGFILIGVPLAAWMLDLTLLQAFALEVGFFLFFLPYTMLYNWGYDHLRARLMRRYAEQATASWSLRRRNTR